MTTNELSPKTVEYLEQQSKGRTRRRVMMILFSTTLVAAVSAGAYFGFEAWQKKRSENLAADLVKDFRPESFEKARQAIDSGQVTREQIDEARRAEFERMERERMDAYFALPVDQRDAYLDKLIDEIQQRMREFRPDRERRPQTRPTTGPTTEPTTQPGERRERATPEERAQRQQQRMDSQAPADRARRAEFRAAMMKRMQERGMNFGGRGPGGGGRGGPGR